MQHMVRDKELNQFHLQMMMRMFAKMIRINLPDLGEGTKEATIKEWFVKEGQKIKEVIPILHC